TKRSSLALSESLRRKISSFGLCSICIDFGFFHPKFPSTGHRTEYRSTTANYRKCGCGDDL
ncbi:hypothetical protein EDD85DRAFT_782392, partial [Armillaria nabsnona]